MLEGSRAFAKEFMAAIHSYGDHLEITKDNLEKAYEWFERKKFPFCHQSRWSGRGQRRCASETKEEAEQ